MIVVSLGGSLINPGVIDVLFLKNVKDFVLKTEERFVLVCGGGKPARDYMSASQSLSDSVHDWVGIEATRLNAALVSSMFLKKPKVFMEPRKCFFRKVLCASGWKPGCSTDFDAVLWAEVFNTNTVFNLTDVDYVYDRDPSKRDANPLNNISWADYLRMFDDWSSGMHAPFDAVAAKRAYKNKMRVVVLNGKKLNNFKKAICNRPFVGTVIE